ncbi:MAG TPA: hypothetical protein VLJ88_14475 [Propionibacteriaceae bacterium]|nr:hypothetical protein [Propionibacteriaceae bacterium]
MPNFVPLWRPLLLLLVLPYCGPKTSTSGWCTRGYVASAGSWFVDMSTRQTG